MRSRAWPPTINIMGGSDISRFSLGFSKYHQTGTIGWPADPKFDRYNVRLNSDYSLIRRKGRDVLKFGENINFSTTDKRGVSVGGIYGNSTMERKHSANMTLAAVVSGKKDTTGSILASLFPQADYMKGQFTWLQKYPWLLPVAYGIRIVRYLKNSGHRDSEEQSSIQIGMERVELLRKYKIIK